MNLWQTATIILAAGAGGWLACDATKAGQQQRAQVALQTQMQTYATDTIKAQKSEAERVISAIVAQGAARAERAAEVKTIIREVQLAPVTTNCVDSPAVRVALAGLRKLAEASPDHPGPVPAP